MKRKSCGPLSLTFLAQCILGYKVSKYIPCEQQVLIELAIKSGDFWWLFMSLQKSRLLNLKCIPALNNVNKTNRNRYNSQS
jgi:hypothetical protein